MRQPPKPPKHFCVLPATVPQQEATIYRALRTAHCEDKHTSDDCQGRLIIDKNGITLACPRCGDARMIYSNNSNP
jgi:predicted RNA-binding Zn-ribbon protein involved in translation (DUF1610 family)